MNIETLASPRKKCLGNPKRVDHRHWRHPSFLALLAAQFISLAGTYLNLMALPWLVLELTGSPSVMTLVILALIIPGGIIGIPAGAIVDRLNAKRLLVALDLARAALSLVIPSLALMNRLEFWVIIVITALTSVLTAPYGSARMLIVPMLVGEQEGDLARANTLLEGAKQLAKVVGPAVAGVLIAVVGNFSVLYINAGTYFVAAVMIASSLRYSPQSRRIKTSRAFAQDIQAGLRFILGTRSIRLVTLVGMFAAMAITTLTMAVLPVFVKEVLDGDASLVGLLTGIWGGRAALGMLAYGVMASRWPWPPLRTLSIFLVGLSLPMWLMALVPNIFASMVTFALASLFSTASLVLIHTLLQSTTPHEIRGRVFAAFQVFFMFGAPLGLVVAGPLMENYGTMVMVWAITLLLTVTSITTWISPILRQEALGSKVLRSSHQ
jgi:MFS family permease